MWSLVNLRSLVLLATTWFYFLVFAQFALLHKVEAFCEPLELKWMLGGMTLFGVAGALLAGARCQSRHLPLWMGGSQVLAVVAAVLAGFARNSAALWVPSILTGLSLGVLTVAVVAWLAQQRLGAQTALIVGAGTGLAYLAANVPFVFQSDPQVQSFLAALVCGLGGCALMGTSIGEPRSLGEKCPNVGNWGPLALAIAVFGGLVWVDSGAFAWMQSVQSFHDAGWAEDAGLWSIGAVHFLAALGTGYLLSRGASVWIACLVALAALLLGYLMIVVAGWGLPGVWVYMTGVSIYSTALVAYPFLTGGPERAASTAAWLFALSGWMASALGIGMVEDLGKMPVLCWILVAMVIGFAVWPVREGLKS